MQPLFESRNAAFLQSLAETRRRVAELEETLTVQAFPIKSCSSTATTQRPDRDPAIPGFDHLQRTVPDSSGTSSLCTTNTSSRSRWLRGGGDRRAQEVEIVQPMDQAWSDEELPQTPPIPHAPDDQMESFSFDLMHILSSQLDGAEAAQASADANSLESSWVDELGGALRLARHQAMLLHEAGNPEPLEGLQAALASATQSALQAERDVGHDVEEVPQELGRKVAQRVAEEEARADILEGRWQTLQAEQSQMAARVRQLRSQVDAAQQRGSQSARSQDLRDEDEDTADLSRIASLQQRVAQLQSELHREKSLADGLEKQATEQATRRMAESEARERQEAAEQRAMLVEEEALLGRLCQRLIESLVNHRTRLSTTEDSSHTVPPSPTHPASPTTPKSWSPRSIGSPRIWTALSSPVSPHRKALATSSNELEQKRHILQEHAAGLEAVRRVCDGLRECISESRAAGQGDATAAATDGASRVEDDAQQGDDATLSALQRGFEWELQVLRSKVVDAKEEESSALAQKVAVLRTRERAVIAGMCDHREALSRAADARCEDLAARRRRLSELLQDNLATKKALKEAEEEAEACSRVASAAKAECLEEKKARQQDMALQQMIVKNRLAEAMRCEQEAEVSCQHAESHWQQMNEECVNFMSECSASQVALATSEEQLLAEEARYRDADKSELEMGTSVAKHYNEVLTLRAQNDALEPTRAEDLLLREQITTLRTAIEEFFPKEQATAKQTSKPATEGRTRTPWRGSCGRHNLQFPGCPAEPSSRSK